MTVDDDIATIRAIAQRWWTQGIASNDDELMRRAMRLYETCKGIPVNA